MLDNIIHRGTPVWIHVEFDWKLGYFQAWDLEHCNALILLPDNKVSLFRMKDLDFSVEKPK